MLNDVLRLVSAAGWFDAGRPFEMSINFTRGACLWLMLSRAGAGDTYVKFSPCSSLAQEALRCEAASRHHPNLAPRFVGYSSQQGLDVLVCRAVENRGLGVQEARRELRSGALARCLQAYFTSAATLGDPDRLVVCPNAELLARAQRYFEASPLAPVVRRILHGPAGRLAAALPVIPQHGDLVLNNIGVRNNGTLVLFDWEDYGACGLPGLDLFTVELSVAGTSGQLLIDRQWAKAPLRGLVSSACTALGVSLSEYQAMAPVYAVVFRFLKRNYGPGVRDQMDGLVLELADARCGVGGCPAQAPSLPCTNASSVPKV